MKLKRVIVLVVLVIVAIVIGFFVYKKVTDNKVKYVEVKFIDDYNHETISTQTLEVGNDAEVPKEPKHDGCKFSGWYNSSNEKITSFKNIQNDLIAYAKCSDLYYKVKFIDSISKRVIDTQKVKYGDDAVAPVAPKHYGYNFVRWKGNYSNVKSNLVVSAIYGSQNAKYIVKYYTVDDGNEKLYATKTFNSYVNRKVTASIITISGYKYNKNYSLNRLSGRVSADNSLVLKVYYDSKTYKIIINGEETTYNYDDELRLPDLEKSVKITYQENEAVEETLGENNVDLTLAGYCKNNKSCDSPIAAGTVINVKENAEYYPVWKMDMELNLPAGAGYELDGETYSFAKWIGPDNVYYFESDKIRFTDDLTLVAVYKKNSEQQEETQVAYTVNTYRDEELYSSITEYGKVGDEILGSLYAKTVSGYEIETCTESIFLSEDPNNNVIEIYYVTGKNEDAPIITRKISDGNSFEDTLDEENIEEDTIKQDEELSNDIKEDKPLVDNTETEIEKEEIIENDLSNNEDEKTDDLLDKEDNLINSNDNNKEDQLEDEDKEELIDKEQTIDSNDEKVDNLILEDSKEENNDEKIPVVENNEEVKQKEEEKTPIVENNEEVKHKEEEKTLEETKKEVIIHEEEKVVEDPPKVDTTPPKDSTPSKINEAIDTNKEEEM